MQVQPEAVHWFITHSVVVRGLPSATPADGKPTKTQTGCRQGITTAMRLQNQYWSAQPYYPLDQGHERDGYLDATR